MFYVVEEWQWHKSRAAEVRYTLETSCLKEAMKARECTLSYKQAAEKYGEDFHSKCDLKATIIDFFSSEKKKYSGVPKKSKKYY